MAISSEMRRLEARWRARTGWPKWLEYIEIDGLRGWTGQRFEFRFPIMALVGENGAGKSTLLQAAAAVYKQPPSAKKMRFASDFFPDTPWEQIKDVTIRYSCRQGDKPIVASIRKPRSTWRGNPDRPERPVEYIDLSRIQPVAARFGYSQLAKSTLKELTADRFDETRLARLRQIMGRPYRLARMARTEKDERRYVPVIAVEGSEYSGFHQGAGETTIAELLKADLPQYGLILIDEIESSLHPRAQRRLIRDLATKCRERECQLILTTHSPYILEELPLDARVCILLTPGGREVVYGVSPEFAMARMDEVPHPECDVFVEDKRAGMVLREVLAAHARDLVHRCRITEFGAASVGQALGTMVAYARFQNPTCVFLDGDQDPLPGCAVLPGGDAPEIVVFEALAAAQWLNVHDRIGRPFADVADHCTRAMTLSDHHLWVQDAATNLVVSGDTLWQALAAEWATKILTTAESEAVVQVVQDAIDRVPYERPQPSMAAPQPSKAASSKATPSKAELAPPSRAPDPPQFGLFGGA